MNKTHSLSSSIVVHSLDMKNDQFRHCEKGKELLSLEVPYFSVICAFMYLANCNRSDIAFSVNLLFIPKDIEMISNIYCAIFVELLICAYFTQRNQNNIL